jgi:hypothetical protein
VARSVMWVQCALTRRVLFMGLPSVNSSFVRLVFFLTSSFVGLPLEDAN